jgi:Putative prokaryotic signal transducing protein
MITLRTFDSSGAASIAKSALDANGILCGLADENAHLYLMAAVPIRLLVSEDQVEEATQILNGLSQGDRVEEDSNANGTQTA